MDVEHVDRNLLANVKKDALEQAALRKQERRNRLIKAATNKNNWKYNVTTFVYTFTDIIDTSYRTNEELQEVFKVCLGQNAQYILRSPSEDCDCDGQCDCAFQYLIGFND